MDSGLKKILRAVSLELRHVLEGRYDDQGRWLAGDLEHRLNELGVWRDRPAKALAELSHLSAEDKVARHIVDAYLRLRDEAGVARNEAVAEFVREAAYTWANRLFALRCMEARSIIDEVVLQKESYGGRSLVHSRFARRNPEACAGEDDGLFAVLFTEFTERATDLPVLFNPYVPAVALRPSVTALKKCIALLSGREAVRGQEPANEAVFEAPDAFGWAYHYWNEEEKDRIFETIGSKKGAKIEGADIIPATCVYTDSYMVKFLVQNCLGALWMEMHSESLLYQSWKYYVKDAGRALVEKKSVATITFLDPACGSGHFLLEAFDLLYSMYEEEGNLGEPSEISAAILNHNLFGIDIDERAVQIAEAALWMKAKEKALDLDPAALDSFRDHLVATNIRLPKGKDHLQAFLKKHPEDQLLHSALEAVFQGLENAPELGSLLQIEEPVGKEFLYLKAKIEENKGKLEQQALFAEVAKPRQEELPFGVESYAQWKARTLTRLRAHFGNESEAANPVQAFFGQAAEKSLVLFDLLSRRYDVVAANPPYLGNKNFGVVLSRYIGTKYSLAKADLYAAFVQRSLNLTKESGRVCMVTRSAWTFLSSFKELREAILNSTTIELLADLGSNAFDSPLHPNLKALLFVLKNSYTFGANGYSLNVAAQGNPIQKATALTSSKCLPFNQQGWLEIEGSPFAPRIPNSLLSLLTAGRTLSKRYSRALDGMSTTNNDRFIRFQWEIPNSSRWMKYVKGGGYKKWRGAEEFVVDWQNDGIRLKNYVVEVKGNSHWSRQIRNVSAYGKRGLTFTKMAGGSLSVRELPAGHAFDGASLSIFPPSDELYLLGLLNSRTVTYFLRSINSSLEFRGGYVNLVPIPTEKADIDNLVLIAVSIKEQILSSNILERCFQCSKASRFTRRISIANTLTSILLGIEGIIERQLFLSFELSPAEIETIKAELGVPVGWLPLISGYDVLPESPDGRLEVPRKVDKFLQTTEHCTLSQEELINLKNHLCALYEAGPSAQAETEEIDIDREEPDEEGDAAEDTSASTFIPTETFLEQLSATLSVHPISVYWLLKEGCEKEAWRCIPEEKRFAEDTFTVIVLRLLGHRWPKQIEMGEQVPAWADRDGIIPITEGSGEKALLERVRERIAEEFPSGNVASIEREFEEIVSPRLEKWLAGPFFKRHISQFKKRPIAWQIELGTRESRARGKRRTTGYSSGPVFSCLVYYHKLDADLLPKIRSQYVGPLKSGYETELRTLERIGNATTDQSARKVQLTNWIDELKALDEKLSDVIVSGFGPENLQSQLRQFAIDDAMLALKARWLQKLIGVVQEGPLESWKQAACETALHPEFSRWIHDALTHLNYHCAAVGSKAPEEKTLSHDPDSAYLSALICREADAIVSGALRLACQKWWKQFDEAVIAPIRQQIAELNEKIKLRKEERELVDWQTTSYQRADIEHEIEDLKDQVSALKDEQAQKVATGQHVRAQIEGWICPEAERWEPWLATQPLYDRISSLDERRSPPRTVAEFIAQESTYAPDINDGVRVNIAPLQRAGLLPAEVIAKKDLEKAIADRAEWRADERRWCREGKLPYPGWWKKKQEETPFTLEAAT